MNIDLDLRLLETLDFALNELKTNIDTDTSYAKFDSNHKESLLSDINTLQLMIDDNMVIQKSRGL